MCDYRDRVLDYLYDEVTPDERRALDRHLEACDVCRDDVRSFRRVREDLLAWNVPAQPSVWTPFAPVAPVPWHRQVPAWAMAAAASLMLVAGAAGGFAASVFGADRAPLQAAPPVQLAAAPPVLTPPTVDPVLVSSLVRQQLTAAGFDTLRNGTPVSVTAPMTARLDLNAERRLLASAETYVGASEQRQWQKIKQYLTAVANEQDLERRRDGESLTLLAREVVVLREIVNGLLAAQQAKVQ
jgi:anti-sigma factor RsiW